MFISDSVRNSLSKWIKETGPYQDVVTSSRVRLARNLEEYPFPVKLDPEKQKEAVEKIDAAARHSSVEEKAGRLRTILLKDLPGIQRQVLVEKHLISPQHADVEGRHVKGVILRDDEAVAIMVNEEDHLRIQSLLPGLQLEEAFVQASDVDTALEDILGFAYDDKFGYLTSCPTNAGTGLRASVMVHLPGLMMTKQISKVLRVMSQVGLAVRGSYGEGTESKGNMFQISNQITLGRSEQEIIRDLSGVTKKLIEQERASRDVLMESKETSLRLSDRIYRSLGILSQARIMSTAEALGLLSELKMGIDIGIVKDIDAKTVSELMVLIRPAYIQYILGEDLSNEERDVARAELIRDSLNKK